MAIQLSFFAVFFLLMSQQAAWSQCGSPLPTIATISLPDLGNQPVVNPAILQCGTMTIDPAVTGHPVGLRMNITHTWQGDISLRIIACGGTLMLFTRPGGGNCAGGSPLGSSNDLGGTYIFRDGGGPNPDLGMAMGGTNTYGLSSDPCGANSMMSSFASLASLCGNTPYTIQVCFSDHTGGDSGSASNIQPIFGFVCGCTDPTALNYNPAATIDDGSCLYPLTCGAVFYDSGGPSGDYGFMESGVTVVCPSMPGEVVTVTFTSFDTQPNSDILWVHNGNNTSTPLISSGNNGGTGTCAGPPGGYWGNTIPGPFTSTHSSGCLTFRFCSNGTDNRAGWAANVTCAVSCTPPAAPTASGVTIQSGQTASLTASGCAGTLNWYTVSSGGSPVFTGSPFVTPALTMNTTYYVSCSTGPGCESTRTPVTVTICTPVTPAFTQLGPYCQGQTPGTLPTTSTNSITGSWSPATISTATAGTTTYTFTPTAGQCANTTTMMVTVNANVTPTFTQLGPYCQGQTPGTLPTTSTNSITGSWSPATISTATAGTTTYTFTPTAGQCATTTTMMVTVNAPATPNFTQLGPYCQGQTPGTLPTTSTNSITGSWSPATISTATAGTTTYTFTPTAGQCATTRTMMVTVNAPATPTFTQLGPYCQGQPPGTLPTTSTNSITGTWSPATISTATLGTTTYTFTPTAGQCATTTTMTVTVSSSITPTFTQVGPVCTGSSFTLPTTSTNGITGTWSPAINTTTTTTYTFTPAAGQCATTTTMTVTVSSSITPTFTQVAPICSGGSFTLPTTSNNSITGTWSPAINNTTTTTYTFTPAAGQCATTTTMTVTVNPNQTPTFTQVPPICSGGSFTLPTTSNNSITGTWSPAINTTTTTTYTFTPAAGQCASTTTMTVTVNPSQTPTFTQVAPICSGGSFTLPATSNNGIAGSWSPAVNNMATTTYTFTPNAALHPCASTATMTVTVNPNVTPSFTQVAPICSGGSFTLPTTSNNSISGSWSPAVNNTATTTYTFTPNAGQCASTTTMTVTVNPNQTPTFTQVGPVCSGNNFTLPATSNEGISGSWSPAVNNMATTTYTFTPNAGQCASTTTMTVTVNPGQTPTFTQVGPVCSGNNFTLPATSSNGISGSWSPAINNMATTTYTFTPNAALHPCASTATMTVTVNTSQTPTFIQVGPICSGNNFTLPTTSNEGITGSWSPAVNNLATTTYTFVPNAALHPCAPTTTMTVTVNPSQTPAFTQILPICIGSNFFLPNVSNNGISGSWSPAINNTATTTYTFVPNAALHPCASTTTMTVVVNNSQTPTFAPIGPLCFGSSAPILPSSSNEGISGTWSPAFINTFAAGTTTYTFVPNAGLHPCATTSILQVTVRESIIISQLDIQCDAATQLYTMTIFVSGGSGIYASVNAGGFPVTNLGGNNYRISSIPSGTGINIQVTDNTGCSGILSTAPHSCACPPIAAPTVLPSSASICAGAPIPTFTASVPAGLSVNWYNVPAGGTPILSNNLNFTPAAGGTYYAETVDPPTNCRSVGRTPITLTITPNQTPSFTQVSPICAGGSFTLPTTSLNGISGSWSPAVNNTATTTYTFTPNAVLHPCASTATMTVTVNPGQTPTFTQVPAICSGGSLTLPTTSTNGIAGTWSPAINNMATTTYTFTPNAALHPCASTTTMTVTVNPSQTPTFTQVPPICAGGTFTLPATSSNGISGSWSPAINNMATTTYTFTPDAALHPCASTATMMVMVTSSITPSFTQIQPICAGGSFSLPATSTNGIAGAWSPAVNNMATTTYTFTPDVAAHPCAVTTTMTVQVDAQPALTIGTVSCAADLLTYSVSFTATGGTVSASAGTITGSTVNGIPAGTNLTIAVSNGTNTACDVSQNVTAPDCNCPAIAAPGVNPATATICATDPVPTFTASVAAGLTVIWYDAATGGNVLLSNNVSFTPAAAGTYFAEAFDPSTNCRSATRTQVTLTINPTQTPTFTQIQPICAGGSFSLPATSTNGIAGTWSPAVNNMATTTYTFTPDVAAHPCAVTTTMTVQVDAQPALTIGTVSCAADLLTYSVSFTATGGTVSASAGTVLGNMVTGIPAGTNLTITVSNGTNTACDVSQNVTAPDCNCPAIAAPGVNPATATICATDPVPTFTASVAAGLTVIWYDAATGGNVLLSNNVSFTPAAAGTYFAEAFDPATNCRSATRTQVTLTINPTQTPSFTQIQPICAGGSFSLPATSTNGIAGSWSPAVNNMVTTTYTFTPDATLHPCASTATMTVTVNPTQTPTFTQIQPICVGGTFSLPATSNNGIAGSWSPAANNTATTTYTFTPDAALHPCAVTATMTVTVNPTETPTFTQIQPICAGGSLGLPTTSNNGIAGTWSPAVNNTATTTYTFTPDAALHPCAVITTMTVTVNPTQTPTFTQVQPICAGGTFSLPASSNNGIAGSWSPAVNNTTTTTYTFTPDATLHPCAVTTTMTVTVNPTQTPTFTQVAPICVGGTFSLPATSSNGIAGSWSPAVNNTATTTYTFTPDAALHPCAVTTTMTVTVNPIQTPTFTQVAPICAGGSLSLPTTSSNGIAGSWSPAVNNTATTTYTFTPDAALHPCAVTATMTVTVNPIQTPTFTQVAPICAGGSFSLPPSSTNGIAGSWSPAVNNTATTTYTFTPDAALHPCASTATMTVTVNPTQTPTFTQVQPICAGGTFSLPPSSNNGIAGSWSPAVNNMATTTYTFTPDAALHPCASTATMTVTVNPTQTPTFTQVAPICIGGTFSLPATSNNGIAGSWSPAVNNMATTTYTFTPDAALHPCAVTTTMTVTVNPIQTPTFTQVAPICAGGTFSLPTTSNNGIAGTWSPAVNNTATTTYTFTPDATLHPCAVTTTMTVTVNPTETPTFTQVAPICAGGSFSLPPSSNNGIAGTWSPAVNNTTTTTYTFTPDATLHPCAVTTTMTVTVNPAQTPTFTQVAPICTGGTFSLPATSNNGIAGTWSPAVNNMATTTYTFTPDAALHPCAVTTTMTVTVNPAQTPTFTQLAPICAGGSLSLPTTSNNGIAGTWSPAVNNMATTTYTFTPNAALHPCAVTATMTVTVNAVPVATANPAEICVGQTATLTASGGNVYQWGTGQTTPTITVTPSITTQYAVTVTSESCSSTTTATVTVHPLPVPSIVRSAEVICTGTSVTLTASGGNSYVWSTGDQSASITVSPSATSSYSVTATDQRGCSASASSQIQVSTLPVVVLSADNPGCYGEQRGRLVIEQISGGVPPYFYSIGNEPLRNVGTLPLSSGNTLTPGAYQLRVQDSGNCLNTLPFVIPEAQELQIDLGPDITIRIGDSILLEGLANFSVDSVIWSPGLAISSPLAPVTYAAPLVTTNYMLTAFDRNGCRTSDQITVYVQRILDVFVPNAFSPNGDGVNDKLIVYAERKVERIRSFAIFNRWGEEMYFASDFPPNDPSAGWDGTYRGKVLNPDVFVYYLELEYPDGRVELLKGDILLIR